MRIDGAEGRAALSWRVRVLMAEHGIHTVSALQRVLKEVGYDVSTQYLARIVNKPPPRISIDLLQALVHIFNCDVGDLLRRDDAQRDALAAAAPVKRAVSAPKRKSVARGASPARDDIEKLLGNVTIVNPERARSK